MAKRAISRQANNARVRFHLQRLRGFAGERPKRDFGEYHT